MSIEDGGESPSKIRKEQVEKYINQLEIWMFSKSKKLYMDVMNVWYGISAAIEPGQKPKQALHYQEYLQRAKVYPEIIEYIMKRSEPEAVAAFDRIVDDFNVALERFNPEDKDTEALRKFVSEFEDKAYVLFEKKE